MSAFQPYAGAYEHDGAAYAWRCYATARVFDIRRHEHAPFPRAPAGRKWVLPAQQDHRQLVGCLVEDSVQDFSQILLQVSPRPQSDRRAAQRQAPLASTAA